MIQQDECPTLPKLRNDLIVSVQGECNGAWVVKDPVRGGFFRFREVEGFILERLDGTASLEAMREQVEAQFGASLPLATLEQFVQKLHRLGFLETGIAPASAPAQRRRIRGHPLYLRFKALDPDRLFERLAGQIRFLFTSRFVFFSAAMILFAVGLTVANW